MKSIQKFGFIIGLLFVFGFFYHISWLSPLAGDDWGYAINGIQNNPFELAFSFYKSWSGRFFSELYGFLVTPNKAFWNFLNATLFSVIAFFIYKISANKKSLSNILIVILLIVSVKDELRMETYTWLMGTTYVIPLALSLVYFYFISEYLLRKKHFHLVLKIVLSLISFYIGLAMENIAVAMVVGNLIIFSFAYSQRRKIDKFLMLQVLISLVSLLIMRLSPGSAFRLMRDHAEWMKLGILDQLIINYPSFINFTFIQNRMLVLVFSVVMASLKIQIAWFKKQLSPVSILSLIVYMFALLISVSLSLNRVYPNDIFLNLSDSTSITNLLFWPIFIITIFASFMMDLKDTSRIKAIFLVLMGGLTNGAMMLAPIFGYRSSIYTVFFMMIVILIVYDEIQLKVRTEIALFVLCFFLVAKYTNTLLNKYELLYRVDQYRLSQIDYYRANPEVKEAWLIRYPIFTIHSGDIESEDTYHMDVFKEYYKLNPKTQLIFYFPETSFEDYLEEMGW